MIALLDADGVIVHASPCEAFDPAGRPLAGRRVWEVLRGATASASDGWRAAIARAIESGAPQVVEAAGIAPGRPESFRVAPLASGAGPLLALEALVTRIDAGEREARADSGLMLTCAQRLAGLGSWIWDVEADRLTWSDETKRILGMAPDEFDGTLDGFLKFVNAADHATLRNVVEQALGGRRRHAYRYRFRGRNDAAERQIAGEGEGQFDASGRLLRVIGTVMDITEREREREAIREGAARFRSLVELSSDWYWEQDANFRFTSISGGRFEDQRNRSRTIGRRRWELAGLPASGSWDEHRAGVEAHLPFRDFEYRLRDSGRLRWISASGEPVFDAQGAFEGYRGTARDITERKMAEDRQRQFTAMLRTAMRLGRSGAWIVELPSREVTWAEGGRAIHAPGGVPVRTVAELLDCLSRESRGEVAAALEECTRKGARFDLEVDLGPAGERTGWLRLAGEAETGAGGDVHRIIGTIQDITERKLAVERARNMRTRPGHSAGAAESLVTLDREGHVTYVNLEAERLLRCSRCDVAGQLLWEQVPALRESRIANECRMAAESGATVEFDEFIEPLGQWLRLKIFPSPQGLAVYLSDITDTSSVRDALLETQEQFRNLFEYSIDGVVCLGPGGRVARANRAACALLGLDEAQLRDRTFESLVAAGDERLRQLSEARSSFGRATGQLTMLRQPCPDAFEAEVASVEYADAHGNMHSFVVFRDVSRRVHGEQESRALNAELAARVQARTAELEAANTELKAFAHSLAHDLRGPIGAIDGFSEVALLSLSEGSADRASHYIERVRASARKMNEFTEGLLSLARVSQVALRKERVDLSAIAAEVLLELRERDPGRVVQWSVQPGLAVHGDACLLRMAIENLLGNAWKFTRGRAVAEIEFSRRVDPDSRPVYRVRDNGAGFDMQYAGNLFRSFQRLHKESEFPGNGIGLANVRRIIQRHDGRVWAEGIAGEGASFFFTVGDEAAAERRS